MLQRHLHILAAASTLLFGMVVTLAVWRDAQQSLEASVQQRFVTRVGDVQDEIRSRMNTYTQVLRSGAALFGGSERPGRAQWQAYVEALRLEVTYPGFIALGVLLRVPDAQREAHEQHLRAEGLRNYTIYPPGRRDTYVPVTYTEPLTARNEAVLGFDMYSDATRRAALELARDTGEPTLTSRVVLQQDIKLERLPGFVMFAPMYKRGAHATTIETRRAALIGYVYAPFRVRDLMQGVLGSIPDVRLEIFDGASAEDSTRLYDTAPALSGVLSTDGLTRTAQLVVLDRVWTIRATALPEFEREIDRTRSHATLAAGIAISLMLTLVVSVLVTLRGRALRLAEEMTTQLRESRERLSLALEGSNLALFDWDLMSETVTLSPRWNALLGGKPAVTITSIRALQSMVHPDDLPRVKDALTRTLKGLTPFYDVEHRVKTHDGTWKWIASHAQVSERDEEGRALRITGTNADISERKAVENLKNEFIGTVSHELRTPLTALIGAIELLKEEYGAGAPPEAAMFLEMAAQNADRLADLVNHILDLEKVESGNLEFRMEDVPLRSFLERALNLNAPYAEQHGTRFALDDRAPGLCVRADADRLMQVMTNLLSNAAKFSPAGETVTVRTRVQGERARIEVIDRGPGVPENFRDRIFSKFAQAASTAGAPSKGGTGLGLAISKAIIEAMRGEIGYDSIPGRGATFYVDLPLRSAST